MIKLESAPQELQDLYIISNTPIFLYKRLRRNPWVVSVSHKYNVDDLIEKLNSLDSEDGATVNIVTLRYAILAAITLKENIALDVGKLDLANLTWGDAFINYYSYSRRISCSSEMNVPLIPTVRTSSELWTSIQSSQVVMDVVVKPTNNIVAKQLTPTANIVVTLNSEEAKHGDY